MNRGDAAAFEVLYYRHCDWVGALAYRFTGDSYAALDVMQETFLYFLRRFPGFQLTANLKTFLYPAVRNLSITARRKAARHQTTPAEMEQLEHTPAPPAPGTEVGDLQIVLAALLEEQRELVLLPFVDGLSLAEIGAAMDLPLCTVKSRLHNALQALRQDPPRPPRLLWATCSRGPCRPNVTFRNQRTEDRRQKPEEGGR
jgi:RNA polymerase sigma-70 factor, ECF subfamily